MRNSRCAASHSKKYPQRPQRGIDRSGAKALLGANGFQVVQMLLECLHLLDIEIVEIAEFGVEFVATDRLRSLVDQVPRPRCLSSSPFGPISRACPASLLGQLISARCAVHLCHRRDRGAVLRSGCRPGKRRRSARPPKETAYERPISTSGSPASPPRLPRATRLVRVEFGSPTAIVITSSRPRRSEVPDLPAAFLLLPPNFGLLRVAPFFVPATQFDLSPVVFLHL